MYSLLFDRRERDLERENAKPSVRKFKGRKEYRKIEKKDKIKK